MQRYNPDYKTGLNYEQVNKRKEENLINYDTTVKTKSIRSIIISNFFTLFNIMNFVLALLIFFVGAYKNLLFIIIVILNTLISTIQEIHSKRTIDKLSFLAQTKTKVIREGNQVHVYMTAVRSHLAPDNIEGIKMGDEVYFHVTNLEQDWDIPHGFGIKGANNGELLIMPGETVTLKWTPDRTGIFPYYCTDFCSALHQEMTGYLRVSPQGSNVPISYRLGDKASN